MSAERDTINLRHEGEYTVYPFAGFASYEHALEHSLTLSEEKISDLRKDHAKAEDWMAAITLMDAKTKSPVQARIETDLGRGPILELSSKNPLPDKITPDTPAESALEVLALYKAKLNFVKEINPIMKFDPKRFIEEKRVDKEVAGVFKALKAPEVKVVREVKLKDIVGGLLPKLTPARTAGIILTTTMALAACEGTTPTVKITPTETVTQTTEYTPTNTPEPTATVTVTPEVFVGDPTNIETWPQEFKDFYVNDPENTAMDAKFQKFIDAIRLDYLTGKVEGVQEKNSEELMWAMIRESAKEQKEIILTPTEVVKILEDKGVRVPWAPAPDMEERYGLWARTMRTTIPDAYLLGQFTNFKYIINFFGREITIPRFGTDRTIGDFVGIVKFPGNADYKGLLVQIRDNKDTNHLIIFRLLSFDQPVIYDSKYLCFRLRDPLGLTPCTDESKTAPNLFPRVAYTDKTNLDSYESGYFKETNPEEMVQWLQWPPPNINSEIEFGWGILDPVTGLEIQNKIVIFPPEAFINEEINKP